MSFIRERLADFGDKTYLRIWINPVCHRAVNDLTEIDGVPFVVDPDCTSWIVAPVATAVPAFPIDLSWHNGHVASMHIDWNQISGDLSWFMPGQTEMLDSDGKPREYTIDGLTLEQIMRRFDDNNRAREVTHSTRWTLTPLQLTAARAEWSRQLREKQAESKR